MPGQVPLRKVSTTLRSPLLPALMLTLPARPARRTTSHSLMPSAMPPGAPQFMGGWFGRAALGLAEAGVTAGIGALARSPAMEPTGRSASRSGGGAGAAAGAGGAASAAGAPQRPSAPTSSSGATGPRGLSWVLLSSMAETAQLGLANTSMGLENQPPSFWSWNTAVAFLQAATASAAAQTNAILETARQRKTISPGRSIRLSLNMYFASSRWRRQAKDGQGVNPAIGRWCIGL